MDCTTETEIAIYKNVEVLKRKGYPCIEISKLIGKEPSYISTNLGRIKSGAWVPPSFLEFAKFDVDSVPFSKKTKFHPNREDIDMIRVAIRKNKHKKEEVAEALGLSKTTVQKMFFKDRESPRNRGFYANITADEYVNMILNRDKLKELACS